jgi:hypothetical protein
MQDSTVHRALYTRVSSVLPQLISRHTASLATLCETNNRCARCSLYVLMLVCIIYAQEPGVINDGIMQLGEV